MNKHVNLKASLMVCAVLLLPVAQAASMSADDYKAAKTRVSLDYKTDKKACAALAGNAQDICIEEAKAKENVANAALKYDYTGKDSDKNNLLETKAKSAYAVAKEKCDDQGGNAKSVCVKEAKATKIKALASAKMGKEITEATREGVKESIDADYKVAVQKCDALAGDAKANCLAAAKVKFGKS